MHRGATQESSHAKDWTDDAAHHRVVPVERAEEQVQHRPTGNRVFQAPRVPLVSPQEGEAPIPVPVAEETDDACKAELHEVRERKRALHNV